MGRWGCPEGKDTLLKPTSTFARLQEQEFKSPGPSVVNPPAAAAGPGTAFKANTIPANQITQTIMRLP